ncbi:hypothetical protein HYS84_00775 [Candidatus Saccharibacteria bacterium]|nr:hypothetical protein [Candidatus Saccharibacteria bacterium]
MITGVRISKAGAQVPWTKAEVLAGLEYFFKLYSRYPTAREIDAFEYLPSSRSIQRQFGGLVVLRSELIPNSHNNFTKGSYRSARAKESWDRAAKYEEEFFGFLCKHFEPVAVHEHKVMRPGNVNSDYYIYLNENSGVVIDLFYAKDLFSLSNVINIKLKRYMNLPIETYFILVGNRHITQENINSMLSNRKVALPSHISINTEENFKNSTILDIKSRSIYSRS